MLTQSIIHTSAVSMDVKRCSSKSLDSASTGSNVTSIAAKLEAMPRKRYPNSLLLVNAHTQIAQMITKMI